MQAWMVMGFAFSSSLRKCVWTCVKNWKRNCAARVERRIEKTKQIHSPIREGGMGAGDRRGRKGISSEREDESEREGEREKQRERERERFEQKERRLLLTCCARCSDMGMRISGPTRLDMARGQTAYVYMEGPDQHGGTHWECERSCLPTIVSCVQSVWPAWACTCSYAYELRRISQTIANMSMVCARVWKIVFFRLVKALPLSYVHAHDYVAYLHPKRHKNKYTHVFCLFM
jgi:hypothetical protein